jgi:membrane fusion protein, multidrug efflux system
MTLRSPAPPSHGMHDRLRFATLATGTSIAACIVALGLLGCAAHVKPRQPRVPVTVARAEKRSVPFTIAATGTVEPVQTAAVGAQVGGTVVRIPFREGDEVRAGQVLIQLDPRPLQSALEQALGVLARDRAQEESARLDGDRAQQLFAQGLLSHAEWDQKRAAAGAWAGTLRMDSAAAATARLNLQYASIRAPIGGRTGRLLVHVGDLVRAQGGDALVTVNQVHPVRVSFALPENSVALVQRHRDGHPQVLVRPSEGDSTDLTGTLVFVDNAVDPASGTLLLKGEFANRDGRLVPGQFVPVRLVLYVETDATVVPAPAVTTGQQGPYVYVLNPDSTVTMRPVRLSRTTDEVAVVASGLQPGETVITDGQFRLSPGAKVMVRKGGLGPS